MRKLKKVSLETIIFSSARPLYFTLKKSGAELGGHVCICAQRET
jgi:hypothetical protein